jgi:hypothetical protein
VLRCPTFIGKLSITSVFACPVPRTGTVEVIIEDEFAAESCYTVLTHGKECEKKLGKIGFSVRI